MPTCRKKFYLMTLALFILFGISACREAITMDSEFSSNPVDEQFFTFDPTTILDDIAKGTESYTPIKRSSIDYSKEVDNVLWSPVEYDHILNSIFENVWQRSPQDFRLRSIYLIVECASIESGGFQYASYEFYKITSSDMRRIRKTVYIDPLYKEIYTSTLDDYSLIRNGYFIEEDYLDPGPDTLTIEEALAIAENASGADYRERSQNKCVVNIGYDSHSNYEGWIIRYFNSPNLSPMAIQIDEHTGEYEINPK